MLSREEFSEIVSRFVGDDTSDEALTTVKNMMETYDNCPAVLNLTKLEKNCVTKKKNTKN